jgi:outer membrane receptor protein involved in Fe transport
MRRNLFGPLWAAGSIAAVACAAPADAQAGQEFEFSLPAQDLSASLRALSVQTGRSIVVSGDLVRGRRAPALSGSYTLEKAVAFLLAGSGLEVRPVGETLVIVGAGGGERPALAKLAGGAEAEGGTIVVTGTHLRGAPASSPMIVIDREEIDRTGATSVEQLMRKLPQNSQAGVNQENFGASVPDQEATDHGAGVNLRGLGQRATLVLLDGRRLAPSGYGSFVDVSLIPLSLIERVEVLTDGASAIYGSDAVGGVVNFILRDRIDGFETGIQAGLATRGGGEQLLVSQAAGTDWDGGQGLLAYEYRQANEVTAGDRSFTIDLVPKTYLLPRERRHSVLASGEQDLADGLTLGAIGTYAHRSTDRISFVSISPIPLDSHAVADAVTLAGELTYALGAGWRARLEGNYGLSDTDLREVQPGGMELVSARDVRNEVLGGAFKVDGAPFDLPGGPLRIAVGAELRHESYSDGFEATGLPRTVRSAERDVLSLFGELSVPLVSARNRVSGIERLELSLAGRFDNYGRTGSDFDPKVGVLWSPVPGLDLRASYGTSFRAPLLSEVGGVYNVIYAPAYLVYQNPAEAEPGSIVAILQGSNPAIQPETSRSWSAGAEISPAVAPGLSLSLNYYSIRFSNRIALPTRFLVVVGDPAFEPLVDRSPDLAELTEIVEGAQVILDGTGPGFSDGGATPADVDLVFDTRVTNTAETTTRGLDLAVRYAFESGANRFVLDANVNHVLAFDDRLTPASPVTRSLDRVYGPLAWRVRGGLGWNRGPWDGSLHVNYAGDYQDDRGVSPVPVEAYATVDLSLSYAFDPAAAAWLRGLRLSLYAENLLDAAPPAIGPDAGRSTGLGYDPVNASGRGRFVSLQLRKSW